MERNFVVRFFKNLYLSGTDIAGWPYGALFPSQGHALTYTEAFHICQTLHKISPAFEDAVVCGPDGEPATAQEISRLRRAA